MQDMGEKIFVQSQERADDGKHSLSERADANTELLKHKKYKDEDAYVKTACESWIDVRSFGQVFAFGKKNREKDGVSIGVRGPVTVRTAVSISPIDATMMQITKSVNGNPSETKGSDTMATKERVEFGLYKFCGSINHHLLKKTVFLKKMLRKLKKH